MLRFIAAILAVTAINGLTSGVASAKSCRDAHGKFIKCPAPMTKAKPCRDAHGKFVKCSAAHKM
jgi:hypothetical protein